MKLCCHIDDALRNTNTAKDTRIPETMDISVDIV